LTNEINNYNTAIEEQTDAQENLEFRINNVNNHLNNAIREYQEAIEKE
jgi:hypothetical protein